MPASTNRKLAPNTRALDALRRVLPAEWRRKVRAALVAEGSIPLAADVLGVSVRTLVRWLALAPAIREGVKLPLARGKTSRRPASDCDVNPAENRGV